jgi:GH35 family endo-1,4-beta-xylanase
MTTHRAVVLSCGFFLVLSVRAFAEEKKAAADPLAPEAIRARIQKLRTASTELTVLSADGKPLANAPVVIRQTRHKFLFGSNGFFIEPSSTDSKSVAYREKFEALLNATTLPFYWGSYEPRKGETREAKLRAMAQWCQAKGITVKGHPLCWHSVTAPWLKDMSPEETLDLQLKRIRREVSGFSGLVNAWDVVNEEVVMYEAKKGNAINQMCKAVGQVPLLQKTFAEARAADPKAILALNDFDTSPRYEKLIREALAAGVPIDVIGIQSHMHSGYWGPGKTWEVCERFAKFGRPLHFTEVTILSGPFKKGFGFKKPNPDKDAATSPEDLKRQAAQVQEFYTVLFSHPKVEAITWWDFSDRGAWLGAPAGLLGRDMAPKPAYEALMKLIKGQWWTGEVKATTDSAGRVRFRGFLGSYAVETSAGRGTFRLDQAGEARATAQLKTGN